MGRGRQKAKQTKVARRLKYYSPETDYAALERELSHPTLGSASSDDEQYDHDPYADESADDSEDDWSPRR